MVTCLNLKQVRYFVFTYLKSEKKIKIVSMVGAIGFEPTTYGTQNRRATRLRHAPNIKGGLAFWAEDEKP